MATYNKNSRLAFTRQSSFRGNLTVIPNAIDYSSMSTVSTYTIGPDSEYRPDLISYKVYGKTSLWWLIMGYNEILDVSDLAVGTVLKIPSQDIFRLK